MSALPAAKHAKPHVVSAGVGTTGEEVLGHLARAAQLSRTGVYPEAECECRAAPQLEPDNPDLHFAVGRILREQNKIDLVIALTPRIPSSLSGMKSSVEK